MAVKRSNTTSCLPPRRPRPAGAASEWPLGRRRVRAGALLLLNDHWRARVRPRKQLGLHVQRHVYAAMRARTLFSGLAGHQVRARAKLVSPGRVVDEVASVVEHHGKAGGRVRIPEWTPFRPGRVEGEVLLFAQDLERANWRGQGLIARCH